MRLSPPLASPRKNADLSISFLRPLKHHSGGAAHQDGARQGRSGERVQGHYPALAVYVLYSLHGEEEALFFFCFVTRISISSHHCCQHFVAHKQGGLKENIIMRW